MDPHPHVVDKKRKKNSNARLEKAKYRMTAFNASAAKQAADDLVEETESASEASSFENDDR